MSNKRCLEYNLDISDIRCSISHQVLYDPVLADDNQIYEKYEIKKWLKTNGTSPLTGLRISKNLRSPSQCFTNILSYLLENYPEVKKEQWVHQLNIRII